MAYDPKTWNSDDLNDIMKCLKLELMRHSIEVDDIVPKNPGAALCCVYLFAANHIKDAAADKQSPDPNMIKIFHIMRKHFPEFSTNKEGGRFL